MIGVVGAVIAYADGDIDLMGLLATIWGAVSIVCIRVGIAKTE